jgi:hypothetical protein
MTSGFFLRLPGLMIFSDFSIFSFAMSSAGMTGSPEQGRAFPQSLYMTSP